MSLGVMMTRMVRRFVLFVSILIIAGCNFQAKDVQLIEINTLKDKEKNDQVAQALMFYAPSYFIHHIPTLNEKNYAGVQPGYVRPSDTNVSNFRVFYVVNNNNLNSSDVPLLKSEFEKFIPIMAREHASKFEVIESESSIKGEWLKGFLNSNGEEGYFQKFSQKVLEKHGEQIRAVPAQLSETLGKIEEVKYLRAQYYKAFNDFPEQVVLNYEVSFKGHSKMFVTISIDEDNQIINLDFKQIMT
jgi:hypothetical protein